ncbi:cytochrome P450 [Cokeromyces recurvatus]|uniref:cytochrome P450 n=1 Tax=Cokeromyces recurvatus TaxID=90255 RepID=UPI00222039FC|nr:cytochrome P450 [Cokeromyces recurvatus]KAI7905070.1 cytochrome P450 [Cokeromyces recurvatus]
MDFDKPILQQIEQISHKAIEYVSDRSNLEKIGKITAISIATYVIADKLYVAFFGPLSRVPGPFYTRFLYMPKFLYDRPSGTLYKTFLSLHDKYGDMVRIGPNTISIANKDLLKQVLVSDDLPKGPIYKILEGNGKHSLFSSTDPVWHKQRRKIVSPAFSIRYLNSLEPFMISVTHSLINRINEEIDKEHDKDNYGIIDIWSLVQCLALDVIGETAFGESFNMIENNSHFVPAAIVEEMKLSAISVMYPLLSKLFLKKSRMINPKLTEFLTGIINHRLNSDKEGRKDILQFLINSQQAENENDRLTPDAIMAETVLFLIAGSETTSNSIGFAIIELLQNPNKLKKLYKEIDSIEMEEGQVVFYHEQLKHLPYLNAVINETLRLDAVAAGSLPRITHKPTVLGHLILPKDIIVLCNLYHVQTDNKYWPNPYEFKPERWIEKDQIELNDLEAFFPFSAGSRNCIGKNFALQEMRMALASLLKYFEIAPIEQEIKDAQDRRSFVTLTVAKNSVRIKIKRRDEIMKQQNDNKVHLK